jgi:hypothetical protein
MEHFILSLEKRKKKKFRFGNFCLILVSFFVIVRSVGGGCDEKSDLWMVDYMGVSRSRSLRSFRGGWLFGSEDGDHLVVLGVLFLHPGVLPSMGDFF